MAVDTIVPWAGLIVALFVFLWLDLRFFAREREPNFRQALTWSVGWFVLSLLVAIPVLLLDDGEAAVTYTTVYLIERSLSLDNLFVFLILFAYFGVPYEYRPRLLFWGIVAALTLRLAFIGGGVALIQQFHFVVYLLGALLLVLAYRISRGVEESVDPNRNLFVRAVRRVYPVTGEFHGRRWFVPKEDRRHATPLFLCLAAIVFADLAFAIDSIPAAFAITRDAYIIWMGNVFALLGLRALFVLVEGLIVRFRYLDQTIAFVLGLVAVKLLTEDLYEVGPVTSFAVIALAFTIGILLSVRADRRDPEGAAKRLEMLMPGEGVAAGKPPSPGAVDGKPPTAAPPPASPAQPGARPSGRPPGPSN